MTQQECDKMRLLAQADTDGELAAAEAAELAAHMQSCPDCATLHGELRELSGRLRAELPRYQAPESLRRKIAALGQSQAPAVISSQLLPFPGAAAKPRRRFDLASIGYFGGGFALAACLALALLPPDTLTMPEPGSDLVAGHIRALQPGHLMDVVSTDQHTVKPWFDGRLDYAPPVMDFAADGFPLIGGRLDYAQGRNVAVLIYQRAKHIIDVYIVPAGTPASGPARYQQNGYNVVRWQDSQGMRFWAISDLNMAELGTFRDLWLH